MKKTINRIIKSVLVVLFGIVMFSVGMFTAQYSGKLEKIEMLIENLFVLDYDMEKIRDVAAKCMVYALDDPYSEYMTKDEFEMYEAYAEGSYKGIGVTVGVDEESGELLIENVQSGGPADIAGIKAGDILVNIDGKDAAYEVYDELVYYIQGISEDSPEDDLPMKFLIKRNGELLEFLIKRAEIKYKNVEFEETDGILYIKLQEFSGSAAEEMAEALSSAQNVKGVVLDLRDNGGGSLTILEDIADLLLPSGILLTTEDAFGDTTEYYIKDDEYCDVPLAVLVNKDTASASEVFSACVKESGRGKLIGETTYGKGLVQAIIPLGDGSGLRLTVDKYYTSAGNYINGIGIEPDIKISDYDEQTKAAFEYVENCIK